MKVPTLFPGIGPNRIIYLLGLSLVLLLLGLYLRCAGFPLLIAIRIKQNIALNNGTEAMKAWENLPKPLEFKIYVFNVTNPEEVTLGERPVLKELGPYVYDEYREKIEVRSLDDDMLAYKVRRIFHFNQRKSGELKESDVVTVLNIPMLGTGYMVEERFPVGLVFLNNALPYLFPNVTNPFISARVGDILFHGVTIKCSYESGPPMPVCRAMHNNRPPPLREIEGTGDFAFSIFQAINSTPSQVFQIYRGNKNIYDLGKIVSYDNKTFLSMWEKNSTCSELKGTDSSILAPLHDKEDIFLYLPEVCLSLKARYVNKTEMYGIPVYKYESAPENFASADERTENSCRCRKVEGKGNVCLKRGAIDATSCQGAPVILTPAHFVNSDPEYAAYPIGLKPNASIHETQVYIEPKTGVPMAAYKRIQMNLFLRRLDGIELLNNVSEGLFPLVWVEEAIPIEMLDTYLPHLKQLMTGIHIMDGVFWLLIGLGLVSFVAGVIVYMNHKKIMCFRRDMVVSNISLVHPMQPGGKESLDSKRTVYNIPISSVDNNNPVSDSGRTFAE